MRLPHLLVGLVALTAAGSAFLGVRAGADSATADGMRVAGPAEAAALAARLDEPVVVQETGGGRHVLTPTGRRIPIVQKGRPSSRVTGHQVTDDASCAGLQDRINIDERRLGDLIREGRGGSYAARELRAEIASTTYRMKNSRIISADCASRS